ncbi:MAG: DUF1569 domain-containing protein [Planctomycetota bacterium]
MKLNERTLNEFRRRIEAITPDCTPQWGSLKPAQILRHLRAHLDVSLGHELVPDESTLMSRTVIKWMIFHVFTRWPKGLPAPAEFFPEPMELFQQERQALLSRMQEFTQSAAREPGKKVLSRAFGPAPLSYFERMHGLHFQHHLRQLGV